jgi:pimeloyl-ACP methyl ester carboxylesterase
MPFFQYKDKDVYYNEAGKGFPLLLLHGNAVSSNMFTQEIEFYKDYFRVIYYDYPGLGQSERLSVLSDDFWFFNAGAAAELVNLLDLNRLHVIGTSGGAIVGLNLAGLIPNRISKMIVDSFFGTGLTESESKQITTRRIAGKSELLTTSFWGDMHGTDWEKVIDADIDLMSRTGINGTRIIQTELSSIVCPVLGVASDEDEILNDIPARMREVIDQIPEGKLIVFKQGKHPVMITRREKFRDLAINFLTVED